jgi:hypothetical protein
MTGSVGQQRIKADFVGIYPIIITPLEVQQEFIEELKLDEKDKDNLFIFIRHQEKKKERYLKNL